MLLSAGYTILREFVAPAELDSLRQIVDDLVGSATGEPCARPNNVLVPLRWDDLVVEAVLCAPSRTRRLREAVAARDLRWISGYVSIKKPQSLPLWWHQDWWCWRHPISYRREAAQVAVLCYLSDTDSANGALRVLPGSHRRSYPLHAALPAGHRTPATGDDPDHPVMRDQPGQETVGVGAGDAVVLDYRTLHGTHANTSPRRRDAILLNFTPSWHDLPADIRGHLIGNAALPGPGETSAAGHPLRALLPQHDGPRRDLPLSRNAPAHF
jgi:ectoine hydroxylase-related dioxygenase (phytanoyl-CoA dioxygenase family)